MTRRATLVVASGLFAVSGFTGLCYETVWFKRLGHVWGSSSLAMASVIAAFLLGLGLGARLFGGVADRSRRPLALYGALEIAIGVLALFLPAAISWLAEAAAPLSVSLGGSPLLLAAVRLALTFALIGPPCIAMGATLPILTRQLASAGIGVGRSAAWLYAFNTLGAAGGAYAAGFHLLETLGLVWTNNLAAIVNIVVGAAALALSKDIEFSSAPDAQETHDRGHRTPLSRVLGVSLAAGAASISLQMVWARELALLVGPTTYAFSSCLFVFILGVGLGSFVFRMLLGRVESMESVLCGAAVLVVAPALLGWSLRPSLAELVAHLRDFRVDATANAVLCSVVSAVLEFAPTLGMGMLFPALVELTRSSATHAGRAVGRVYAWNTIGSVAGAALTSALLVPAIGSFWSLRAALAAYAAAPVVLFGASRTALWTSCVLAAALLAQWRGADPMDTNLGGYVYGPEAMKATRADFESLFFSEGPSCNVLVLEGEPFPTPFLSRPPERLINLRVHGKIDASTANDMPTQLGMAYFPLMLGAAARDVLVIGMGSGATFGAAAVFSESRVTCCELEPGVVEAARFFEQFNHGALDRDNVTIVLDDGRSYVQGHPGPWDLIVSQPSNPWIAGVANLFTADFYRTARGRLARGGLFAQWIQAYSFTAQDFALVLRTLSSVFPHCALLRISDYDVLIVASDRPVRPRRAEVDAAQALMDATPEAQADLERYYGTTDVRSLLLAKMLMDEKGVARFLAGIGGDELNTDANMRLEFEAPRRLFHERGDPAVETNRRLYAAADAMWQQAAFAEWGCSVEHLPALKEIKSKFLAHRSLQQGGLLVALGLAHDADDPELIADHLLFSAELGPQEFEEQLARLLELSAAEAHRLGQSLIQLGQFNAAKLVYQRTAARYPQSATAWRALSACWAALGNDDEAQAAAARVRELDPLLDPLLSARG